MNLTGYRKLIVAGIALVAELLFLLKGIDVSPEAQVNLADVIILLLGTVGIGGTGAAYMVANVKSKKYASPNSNGKEGSVVIPTDIEGLKKHFTEKALRDYGSDNPIPMFYAARDFTASRQYELLEPYSKDVVNDMVAEYGLAAYEDKNGFDYYDTDEHLKDSGLSCPYKTVGQMMRRRIDHWAMLIGVERALRGANWPQNNWSGYAPK